MLIAKASSAEMPKTYVIEHLDPELGPWSTLEYLAIAQECSKAGASFYLSSVPTALIVPHEIGDQVGIVIENRTVENIFVNKKRVCLLDPAAAAELSPDDASVFDIFLFGGILGIRCV